MHRGGQQGRPDRVHRHAQLSLHERASIQVRSQRDLVEQGGRPVLHNHRFGLDFNPKLPGPERGEQHRGAFGELYLLGV